VVDSGKLQIVTTTALLADLVKNAGGELVEVRSVVPPGADVHSFQTTPDDSIALNQAQVIVSNGFGLDAFLEPVLAGAKKQGAVRVIVAEGLPPVSNEQSTEGDPEAWEDPHLWQNPEFATHYVRGISNALAGADPAHERDYQANAGAYIDRLRDLDREVGQTLDQVPTERRHLVTFHKAFGHFARRYGWRSSAFVAGDADEASPAAIVRVLEEVKSESLPAIFVGPQFRSAAIRQAALDADISIGTIYSDLFETGPSSYIEMIRANTQALVSLLK